MNILNFGSLNLDFVYAVDHIARPGETVSSRRLDILCGGKGLNQSLALARAGATVAHAGMIGPDGEMLLETCLADGVDATHILRVEERSGSAFIQVGAGGENSIVLFGGANRRNKREYVDTVLAHFKAGDILLLQNEINLVDYLIEVAAAKGMRIVLNPSPFDESLAACDLGKVSLFMLNEIEGELMSGEKEAEAILDRLCQLYPNAGFVLTLGERGAFYRTATTKARQEIFPAKVVDTTAAGDTFTGYFLAARTEGQTPADALRLAAAASAIAVSRQGAAVSIPRRAEVEEFVCQSLAC